MPNFEVHYSFECPKCKAPNSKCLVLPAEDKQGAEESAFSCTVCSECGAHLSERKPFTAMINEV